MTSRLISSLTVSFSGLVFSFEIDSSFLSFESVIVHIDGVCIGLGESLGVAINVIQFNAKKIRVRIFNHKGSLF